MKFGRAPTTFRIFMLKFLSKKIVFRGRRFSMFKLVLAAMFVMSQLSGPGGALPQILHPEFKPTAPLLAGKRGEMTVSFTAVKGYSIDRTLPLTLKLAPVSGVTFTKTDLAASGNDP